MTKRPSHRWILGRITRCGLLTPRSLALFAAAAISNGGNLGALLRFCARRDPDGTALVNGNERLSFAELAQQCDRMAAALRDVYHVRRGAVIGVLGRNGGDLVRAILASTRLGARVYLLNPEMSRSQLAALVEQHGIRLVLATSSCGTTLKESTCQAIDAARLLANAPATYRRLGRVNGGELVMLTGGTTGPPKAAVRRPDLGSFLRLFLHLVATLRLDRCRTTFIAVPLFHGYGLASFLVALALGRAMYLMPRFDAAAASALIEQERIEALIVVPSMLQRIFAEARDLSCLRCIVSGGAALPPALAAETQRRHGDVLFNLYGTSEAGVAVCATPEDLAAAPGTIGRELWGVQVLIRSAAGEEVGDGQLGRIGIASHAAVAAGTVIETGDLGYRDRQGRLFVQGRLDDMIVSGGENVSPWELETVLCGHSDVCQAVAVGVPDPDFGQRLAAFVVARPESDVTPGALGEWLKERLARYQRPRSITLVEELPLTAIGKIDRNALRTRGTGEPAPIN